MDWNLPRQWWCRISPLKLRGSSSVHMTFMGNIVSFTFAKGFNLLELLTSRTCLYSRPVRQCFIIFWRWDQEFSCWKLYVHVRSHCLHCITSWSMLTGGRAVKVMTLSIQVIHLTQLQWSHHVHQKLSRWTNRRTTFHPSSSRQRTTDWLNLFLPQKPRRRRPCLLSHPSKNPRHLGMWRKRRSGRWGAFPAGNEQRGLLRRPFIWWSLK